MRTGEIVITDSDKGKVFVVFSRDDYREQEREHL
jgi:hypothetical protein